MNSPDRRSLALALVGALLGCSTSAADSQLPAGIREVGRQAMARFAVADTTTVRNLDTYRLAAEMMCGPDHQPVCVVDFWADSASAAVRLPMTDQQVNTMVVNYTRNPAGVVRFLCHKRFSPTGASCEKM